LIRIEEGGGNKTTGDDLYDVCWTPVEVAKCIVRMEAKSAEAIINCSHTPSVNEFGDGKVPTSERPLTQSRIKYSVASKHQPVESTREKSKVSYSNIDGGL
jgi:hypothetical protein